MQAVEARLPVLAPLQLRGQHVFSPVVCLVCCQMWALKVTAVLL